MQVEVTCLQFWITALKRAAFSLSLSGSWNVDVVAKEDNILGVSEQDRRNSLSGISKLHPAYQLRLLP